jgi:hypothetical protein
VAVEKGEVVDRLHDFGIFKLQKIPDRRDFQPVFKWSTFFADF